MQLIDAVLNFFYDSPWLQALIAVVVAYLFAMLVDHFVPRGLYKLGNTFKFQIGEKVIGLVKPPIFFFILFIGFNFAIELLNLEGSVEFAAYAALDSVFIVVVAVFLYRLIIFLLQRIANTPKILNFIQPRTLPLFNNLVFVITILSTVYGIFSMWSIDMSALLASAGIVGLAVGMAARETLSDVIAGILILTDSPYQVDDIIILEDGTRGKVTNIGIRSTCIKTIENYDVIIPNAKIGNSKILNETSNSSNVRLIFVNFMLPYDTDIDLVRAELLEIAAQHKSVFDKPPSSFKIIEFVEERILCRLQAWIDAKANRYLIEFELNETAYKRLCEAGVAVYKDSQEIHVKEMPPIFGRPNVVSTAAASPHMSATQKASDILLKTKIKQPVSKSITTPTSSSQPPLTVQTSQPPTKTSLAEKQAAKRRTALKNTRLEGHATVDGINDNVRDEDEEDGE